MASLPTKRYTPEEYLERERLADYKSEYYSGEIFAMGGATRTHNLIAGNVFAAIKGKLGEKPCEVYMNHIRVQGRSAAQYSYPDVVVVCGQPLFLDSREDTLLNPPVIIEVLSPSTEAFDRGGKFLRYRQIASFAEYVLIAQDTYQMEHFERQSDGSWRLREAGESSDSVSLSFLGCVLTVAEVYDKVRLEPRIHLVMDEPR